jgi:beta-glucosidase
VTSSEHSASSPAAPPPAATGGTSRAAAAGIGRRGFITAGALAATTVALSGGRAAAASAAAPPPAQGDRPWLDASKPIAQRVDELLAEMTLPEKASELTGIAPPPSVHAVGYIPGNSRLGIPPLVLSDGPAGVRDPAGALAATALPAPLALAATFDPPLAQQYGSVMGHEAVTRGVNVLYGPAINIIRVPQGGRDFEYLGEDPVLTSAIGSAEVSGIQSWGVAAQVKHFAANNQENGRHDTSSDVSERALREIYLPAFKAATTGPGHAMSLMAANNMVNGFYNTENSALLNDVLRGEWGFNGVVGSDYAAVASAIGAALGGLDQEFTLRDWTEWYRMLPSLVQRGVIPQAVIDEHVRHVLTMMFGLGLFGHRAQPAPVNIAADGAVARQVAEESAVLLKNDSGLLPLDSSRIHSIAVLGTYAATALTGGGGSSHVAPYYSVSPVDAIRQRAGADVTVTTADGSDLAQAGSLAAAADVAVVVVNDVRQEGVDLPNIDLPGNQNQLIQTVAAANPHTVVVLNTGGPVTMPWLSEVLAVLECWYPGEEDGNALAALLFGDVAPSGKLPVTFPVSLAQSLANGAPRYPAQQEQYVYNEDLKVGYRWYDANDLTPLFPFGYGLSYTTFGFSGLHVAGPSADGSVTVQATVTNAGTRPGTEVAQLYIGYPAASGEPPRALKAFTRVTLAPGQHQTVTFHLDRDAFQTWDEQARNWGVAGGTYPIWVGDSSRNLPLQSAVTFDGTAAARGVSLQVPPVLAAGSAATITATFTNTASNTARQVAVRLQGPAGWNADHTATFATVPAHQSVTARWRVAVPAAARPGTASFTATASYAGQPATPPPAHARGQVPYPQLSAAFNEEAITADGDTSVLADMFSSQAYSAQALASAGLPPGGQVTHDGLTFTLPSVASGQFDNAAGMGQTIKLDAAGNTLGLLVAGVWGTQAGTFTITYTDGTTQQSLLEAPDWQDTTAPAVGTAAYINNVSTGATVSQKAGIFYDSIPLKPGATIAYLTLPGNSRFHVFALAVG